MTREETLAALRKLQLLTKDQELSYLLNEFLENHDVDLTYDS